MLNFLSSFRSFLTFHKVGDAVAQKVAASLLGKMDKGVELTGDENRLAALFIKIGDIKGEGTRTAFVKAATQRGYTEVEWTYALASGPAAGNPPAEQLNMGYTVIKHSYDRPKADGRVGALRRRPTKISPPASGYTEVEWTYHKSGAKVPDAAGIAAIAQQVAGA